MIVQRIQALGYPLRDIGFRGASGGNGGFYGLADHQSASSVDAWGTDIYFASIYEASSGHCFSGCFGGLGMLDTEIVKVAADTGFRTRFLQVFCEQTDHNQ